MFKFAKLLDNSNCLPGKFRKKYCETWCAALAGARSDEAIFSVKFQGVFEVVHKNLGVVSTIFVAVKGSENRPQEGGHHT